MLIGPHEHFCTGFQVGDLVKAPSLLLLVCSRNVFPQGLPDEYAFVTTFKFRKTSRREDWYLWQVYDKYGIPQVSETHCGT